MGFKMSYVGIIVLLGALLALVGVFLDWYFVDITNMRVSGWDIFDLGDIYDLYYLPLIVLILAALALILGLLEFAGKSSPITRILLIVFGLLIAVLSFVVYNDIVGDSNLAEMGIGLYMEIIAGIMLILAPVLAMAGVLKE